MLALRIGNDVSYETRINHEIHFAWQAQYLVKFECDFSWQAQHLVTFWNDSQSAKCCIFQYKMLVVGVKSNVGCEAGCGLTVSWSDHARIILRSFSDHARIMVGSAAHWK